MAGIGTALAGFAQGFEKARVEQIDADYLKQQREQQLQGMALANQQATLQNALMQQQQADQQTMQQAARAGLAAVAQQDSAPPNAPTQTPGGTTVSMSNWLPGKATDTSGLGFSDVERLAKESGVPAPIVYGTMMAESSANPNAVGPELKTGEHALGLFQVLPSTAAKPGYGLSSFDPKDPDNAVKYMGKMYALAGGDFNKFTGAWNAGPANMQTNNPQTQAFRANVQKYAQEYQLADQTRRATAQVTPAQTLATREQNGVTARLTDYQVGLVAQHRQYRFLMAQAQQLDKMDKPMLAQQVRDKAAKVQAEGLDLQEKYVKLQKGANEEVANLFAGVDTQAKYDTARAMAAQNPMMQQALRGVNLTGNLDADRDKIGVVASRMTTAEQQQKMKLDAVREETERSKQRLAEQKAQAPLIQAAKDDQDYQTRKQQYAPQGVPVVKTPTNPDPVLARREQLETYKQNQKVQTQISNLQPIYRQEADAINRLQTLLDTGADTGLVGGVLSVFGKPGSSLSGAKLQEFDKVASQLVDLKLQEDRAKGINTGAAGGTAARYTQMERMKADLAKDPDANRYVLQNLRADAEEARRKNEFTLKFMQANPQAPAAMGETYWGHYRNAVPLSWYNPETKRNGPFPGAYALGPDQKPNPNYVSPERFFREKEQSGGLP